MTRQQTTPHREGAHSLSGRVAWLVGGNLQDERFSVPLSVGVRRLNACGCSMPPRTFPLIQINHFGRSPSPAVKVGAVGSVVSSLGRRPFSFELLKQGLQLLAQFVRVLNIHGAFSNALRFLQSVKTMQGAKSWKRNTKLEGGEK